MYLFTKMSRPQLEMVADRMGIQLYNYDKADVPRKYRAEGRIGHKFVLRPNGREAYQRGGNGRRGHMQKNRVWAVSWAGHYVFMRATLLLDNDAVYKTAIGIVTGDVKPTIYAGLNEFDIVASITGESDIGSQMDPMPYQESQAAGHVEWDTENDLRKLSEQAAGMTEREAA